MTEQKIINHTGLTALRELAQRSPGIFIDADLDVLHSAVTEAAKGQSTWSPTPLDLRGDLSPLNAIQKSGPDTDREFAWVVRGTLGHLTAARGLDEYIWATINCFVIPRYVSVRWQSSNQANKPEHLPAFVRRHWLDGGTTEARQDNAIARLWWLGEFAARAAQHSDWIDDDQMLDAMANRVNLYHQLLRRRYLCSRPKLVAAIYEVFLSDSNDYLNVTRYASELLRTLNFLAAEKSLDFMSVAELREVVEEAKPPKEP